MSVATACPVEPVGAAYCPVLGRVVTTYGPEGGYGTIVTVLRDSSPAAMVIAAAEGVFDVGRPL